MRGIGEVVLLLGLLLGLVGLAVNSFVLTEDFGLSPIVAYLLLCTGPLVMAVLPSSPCSPWGRGCRCS
jgi:hypothetical protein